MASNQHVVKATLIVVRADYTEHYLEKGATLPEGVSAADRKRLTEAGLIEKAPAPEKPSAPATGTGDGSQSSTPATSTGDGSQASAPK
ncbi:hypothetical protein SEA_POPPER_9 [Arthrobacter phage Popper]|uniref:Uncharacterized protein n=1 Tax=Arthrobacter phage Popper TaxID=2859633 RepID=A0AAE7WD73_9CAUD|nr:hypothetical protein QEO78_gp09 [Arthrobacter phage Popper]QYC54928.1 hypothetical protein SEA_POPPER_9 [Arthrobacter phage Popper]